MNITENITSSFKSVFANKMRALLTMLGIIIGIGSVILISAIGSGSQAQITEQFNQMGVGRLTVQNRGGRNTSISAADVLNMKDYEMLKEDEAVKYASPVYTSNQNIKLSDETETKAATLTGVGADYKDIMSPTMLYGRYISDADVDLATSVVVINDTTAEKVFGVSDESVLGEKVSIKTSNKGTIKYTVVGITKNANAANQMLADDQFPETVIMPISTLQRMAGTKNLSSISIVVNDVDVIDDVAADLSDKLDKFRGTTEKYYIQNPTSMMEQINSVMGQITLLISAIAGISLVVGGIGVMNIMLVTVTERTREIGIRKSIGARNTDIQIQFLIESVILTGIGGVLGLLLGWVGGQIAGNLMSIKTVISASSVFIAVGISSAIGIVFGVYPASKAARLDPIEALRYE